jgi:hypothetical protein
MTTEKDSKGKQSDIPERIKKDAPKMVLKPDGSWRAMARQVDRTVQEKQDAADATNKWAQRMKEQSANLKQGARGMGVSFRRSSKY